jgi:hypothetical protein
VRIAQTLLIISSLILFHGLTARAASDASSKGSWLPFSDSASKAAKTKKVSSNSSTPSVVTNLSNGTKHFVTSTKNILTPKKQPSVRKSGTTGMQVAKDSKPADKPGFFKSMFHPEPPPPPKTIKEWMSLKQIHP